ncbi:hypothetical protein [Micromonospora sp. LOL_023]|uniref:hypothetical protein n=1 Tax=Micromonospora sp. LOL_023 TaxID=3345418 RepID=UPI003A86E4C5
MNQFWHGTGCLLTLADSVTAAEEPGSTRLDDLVRRGAKVRVRQTDLPDAIVLDRNLALLRERSDGRASMYVIRHKVVVGSLAKLLSTAWQSAVELDSFRRLETSSDSLTLYVVWG